jgi:hypothetical protein
MDADMNPWGEGPSKASGGTDGNTAGGAMTDEDVYRQGPGALNSQARRYFEVIQRMGRRLEEDNDNLKQKLSDLTAEITNKDISLKQLQDELQRARASLAKGKHATHPIQSTAPLQGPGPRTFSIKVGDLPKFSGKREGGAVLGWLKQLERRFITRCLELELPTTDTSKWAIYSVLAMEGDAATWAGYMIPTDAQLTWPQFRAIITQGFIPAAEITRMKQQFERLRCGKDEAIAKFNQRWRDLRLVLDLETVVPPENVLIETYLIKIADNRTASLAIANFNWQSGPVTSLARTMQIAEDLDGRARGIMANVAGPSTQNSPGDPMDVDINRVEGRNYNRNSSYKTSKTNQEDVVCYTCSEKGHIKRHCPIEAYFRKNPGKRPKDSHTGGNQYNPREEKDSRPVTDKKDSKDKKSKYRKQFYRIEEVETSDDEASSSNTTSSDTGKGDRV